MKTTTSGHVLSGYWWDPHSKTLRCKIRGLDSFCFQLDLLTLSKHPLGRDAIETIFFSHIDTKGAQARDILVNSGPSALSTDERRDFARLLLSLEARRPVHIERLRTTTAANFRACLNSDPELLRECDKQRDMTPSDFLETTLGYNIEDSALTIVQHLVDNPKVGFHLINAHWHVRKLEKTSLTLIISDRPLIRIHGYNRPGATWLLPLSPDTAFIACNDKSNLTRLMRLSDERFAKELNKSSIGQTERFVFCIDRSHENFISKNLKARTQSA